MKECIYKGVGDYEYFYDEWKELNVGDKWGNNGWSAFFKNSFDMPERFAGKKVTLNVYFGGDSLLSLNGEPYQGLDPFRNSVLLSENAAPQTDKPWHKTQKNDQDTASDNIS